MRYCNHYLKNKLNAIRERHHKVYRPKFIRLIILSFIFVAILILGLFLKLGDISPWDDLLSVFGLTFFITSLILIFNLGNEDDRAYFLACIREAENEDELMEMGFDEKSLNSMKDIFFRQYNQGELEDIAWSPFFRALHKRLNLRKVADEIEDYERLEK